MPFHCQVCGQELESVKEDNRRVLAKVHRLEQFHFNWYCGNCKTYFYLSEEEAEARAGIE